MRNENADAERHSEDDLWQNLREQFEDWWNENGRTILVVAIVAAVILVAYNAYRNKVRADETATWATLDRLPDVATLSRTNPQDANKQRQQIVESCENILESRWTTSATPWVLLKMANAQQELGKLADAVAAYDRLTENYPESRAADMSQAPLAGTLEEMGQYQEAAEIYRTLAEEQGNDSLHWLDVARNLELAGQIEEAMKHYRQLTSNLDESTDIAQAAAYRLSYLKEGKTLTPPPPPPPEEEDEEEATNKGQAQSPAGQEGKPETDDTQAKEDEKSTQKDDTPKTPAPADSK